MAQRYRREMFSEPSLGFQEQAGSRAAYAEMDAAGQEGPDPLGDAELAFITACDSFYLASVTPDGWPYVQHRGGPPGFLRWLGGNRLGFADFRGNRQYISRANLTGSDRVAVFIMDYPRRGRLKLIGHARTVEAADDPDLARRLALEGYRAAVERAVLIEVVGFDWNCSQHITPRYTAAQVQQMAAPLTAELEQLRAEVARLRGEMATEA